MIQMIRKKKVFAFLFAAVLGIAVISGCSKKESVIKIATKPMTEQLILGEMLAQLIEADTDLKVEITKGVGGGTSNIHPALLKGDFDLYPEYTGTGWLTVLKETELPEDEALFEQLKQKYEEEYQLKWLGLYGFNNTYTLVVRNEIADKYNLKTFSDLAVHSKDIVFGGNSDFFEREDGLKGLITQYGFQFKDTIDIDIALKYKALSENKIDVTSAFTTDAGLSKADVLRLEDDKKFFKNYYCGTVIREETLKEHPELEAVLNKMENLITNEDMSKLNYSVEEEKVTEEKAAHDYLAEKGLLN